MTKTQEAKALYRLLRNEGVIGILFTGLVADRMWVADHDKAYRIEELGNIHLMNIIDKYRRKDKEVPKALSDEYARRQEAK